MHRFKFNVSYLSSSHSLGKYQLCWHLQYNISEMNHSFSSANFKKVKRLTYFDTKYWEMLFFGLCFLTYFIKLSRKNGLQQTIHALSTCHIIKFISLSLALFVCVSIYIYREREIDIDIWLKGYMVCFNITNVKTIQLWYFDQHREKQFPSGYKRNFATSYLHKSPPLLIYQFPMNISFERLYCFYK